jgi:hypothetical protein
VVEPGAVTPAAPRGLGGVPTHRATQMRAGETHTTDGTGRVAAGADDLAVVAHNGTMAGNERVDSLWIAGFAITVTL